MKSRKIRLIFSLILYFQISNYVYAQTNNDQIDTNKIISNIVPVNLDSGQAAIDSSILIQQERQSNIFEKLFELVTGSFLNAFFTVLFTIIFTFLPYFTYRWGKKRAISSFYPRKIKRGTRKNTVLVIGLGRSGKSCLIKTLTKSFDAGKPRLTYEFEIISCKRTDTLGEIPIYFHFTDYRGQSFKQLIENFIKEQFNPDTLLRYNDINTLILVVDLFEYNESERDEKTYPRVDSIRINEHLSEWNRTAMDAVFGLLTQEKLKYVCLFINKIDKWTRGNTRRAKDEILILYQNLIQDVENRIDKAYTYFDVIIGSALVGTNIDSLDGGLRQQLYEYSVPLLETNKGNKNER